MALPQIAIVGRPNVGKSSLLNRLARRRVSIVDPTPGVTRDRVSAILEIDAPLDTPRGTPPKLVEVVDTGGYGVYVAEGGRFDEVGADLSTLTPDIESQIRIAREQSRLVLFVIDAQAGLTALDDTIARILREEGSAARVAVVANKVDSEEWVPHGLEAAGFGLGEPLCVSATSAYGMRELLDAVYERIDVDDAEADAEPEMKIAIVGKRNAGKSTLINMLAGDQRVIVSEIAGTTRDSVDVRFEIGGRAMIAIDTAGFRKRKSFADNIEYYAYHRMLAAIRRADVVMLMLDASHEVSQVDKKLAQEISRQYKPTVIVVNKWDLVDESKTAPEDYLQYLTEQLYGFDYAPIVFISASEGEGITDVIAMAFNLYEQAGHRESTGQLNRVIEEILQKRGPSSRLGTQAKLYYASQIDTHPPTIVLKVNHPKLFEGQYERYLLNRMREELPFSEVPIRLLFSSRIRLDLAEMKHRGKTRPVEDANDE
jgi:GTP-binding protein